MRERGDRVVLRDLDGRSLQEHILTIAPSHQRWHFPESTSQDLYLHVEGWIDIL